MMVRQPPTLNRTTWIVGDIVLQHDDGKIPERLMVIESITEDGIYRTTYILKETHEFWGCRIWKNRLEHLYDPAQFGIDISQAEKERFRSYYGRQARKK